MWGKNKWSANYFQYISNFRLLIQRYAQFCIFGKSCHILYMIFQEKCFSCYTLQLTKWLLYKWTNVFGIVLLPEILGNMCVAVVCSAGSDVINFEINLLSNQAVFLHDQKVKAKPSSCPGDEVETNFKYLENEKRF